MNIPRHVAARPRMLLPPDEDQRIEDDIADAIADLDEVLSSCCGARFYPESDICRQCGEHASATGEVRVGQHYITGDPVVATFLFDPIDMKIQSWDCEC